VDGRGSEETDRVPRERVGESTADAGVNGLQVEKELGLEHAVVAHLDEAREVKLLVYAALCRSKEGREVCRVRAHG
jgi:hypothetical protein